MRISIVLGAALTFACSGGEDDEQTVCEASSGNVCTVVGQGKAGLGTDGVGPLDVLLYLPQDMIVGPDGILYILDWNNHRVRAVIDGKVETIIGNGYLGDAPNGVAGEISLNHPTHIAFSPDGKLILSAWHNSKVVEMDQTTKEVKAICGTGMRAYGGDGGPAAMAILDLPVATAFDSQNRMLIMDQANQRIRRIESDGTIQTIVGPSKDWLPPTLAKACFPDGMGGEACKVCKVEAATDPACEPQTVPKPQGYAGDGGMAVDAFLYLPFSQSAPPSGRMEMGPNERLYIADTGNERVRAYDPDGTIRTIAGSGPAMFDKTFTGGYSGDGGPATEALLKRPTDVAVADDGTFYIADTDNHCIRKVDPNGIISTYAGRCGESGFDGDGAAATNALFDRPYGVALDPDGNLYVADTHNHRIRIVYR